MVLWFRYNCGIVVPIHQRHCGAIHQWHRGSHTSVYCHSHTTAVLHTPILACRVRQWDSLSKGKYWMKSILKPAHIHVSRCNTFCTSLLFLEVLLYLPHGTIHLLLLIQKVVSEQEVGLVVTDWPGLNSDPNPLDPCVPSLPAYIATTQITDPTSPQPYLRTVSYTHLTLPTSSTV